MNATLIINIGVLTLTLVSPFISLYAISFIKKGDFKTHITIQKRLFYACIIALLTLEGLIRYSGGSGSLVAQSAYVDTSFFKILLPSHISGAVLTYIIWAVLIFLSSKKHTHKNLPGTFSKTHKTMGKMVIVGLFYTAITALLVFIFTFVL